MNRVTVHVPRNTLSWYEEHDGDDIQVTVIADLDDTPQRTPNPAIDALTDRLETLDQLTSVKFDTDRRAIDATDRRVRELTARVHTLEGKVLTVNTDPQDGVNVHSITGTVVAHGPDCFWVNLDRDVNGPPHQRIDCPDAERPQIGDYYTVTNRLQGA